MHLFYVSFCGVPPHTKILNVGRSCHYIAGYTRKYIFPFSSINGKISRFKNAPILRLFLW